MNELKRILSLSPRERTAADIEYLEKHVSELTPEQHEQLDKEGAEKKAAEDKAAEEVKAAELKVQQEKEEADRLAKEQVNKDTEHIKTIHLSINSKDLGEGEVEAIISSGSTDRHGEKIDIDGMDTRKYMKNPVVLWAHDSTSLPIAMATKLWKESGKLMGRFKFAVSEYPFAKTVYELVRGGFIRAVSVGFIPLEMEGNVYSKSEMLEFSVVPVPANPEALIFAKQLGLDMTKILEYSGDNMLKLKDVLAKAEKDITSLSYVEVKFLNAHLDELTDEQKKMCASVIEEKQDVAEIIEKAVTAAVEPLKADIKSIKDADPVIHKNIAVIKNDKGEVSKEMKFFYYAKGIVTGDFSQYREVTKSAMDTTDTSAVLPPEEFIAEVQRLEEQYGVAVRFADVRRSTNGAGLRYVLGNTDLVMYDTAEGGVKKSSKNSYLPKTLLWRKFAGILPLTDELNEDSAVQLFNDAADRFARARSQRQDNLIFTEASNVSPKNHGILAVSGTHVETLTGGMSTLSFDVLSKMQFGVPTPSAMNGQYWLHRELLGAVQRIKDSHGDPIWRPGMADGVPPTILGKPYQLVDVLPSLADDEEGLAFMAFGDLKYATLGIRKDLEIKIFDAGVVGDPDEVDQEANTLNLITQDIQVMRGVTRMNGVIRFPAAFSVAKTAETS